MAKGAVVMAKIIELSNMVKPIERCLLNLDNGSTMFHIANNLDSNVNGRYYCEKSRDAFSNPTDGSEVVALYTSENGPVFYFKGREYGIYPDLNIEYIRIEKKRKFKIIDYNIEIEYDELCRLGWDIFMLLDEDDVDLFFMIEQRYKNQEFYDQYTLNLG